jgi:hypothetical protein
MKKAIFILLPLVFLSPLLSKSQSIGDYRTVATGNWASNSIWETYTGLAWIPAIAAPTPLNGNISIRNTHTVTVTANTTADQVTIDAGGTLVLSSNTLTLGLLALDNLVCNGALEIAGGNLNIALASTLTINGTMSWTDGDIAGVLTTGYVNVTSGGTLTLNTAATKDLLTATININSGGTMNWDDGDINLNLLGTINNNGNINTSCNNTILGLGTFNNNSGGVFSKTSTGTTTFNVIVTSVLGTFKGVGTYDFNNLFLNAGTISPGLSPGIVIVTYADLDPLNYPLLGTNSDLDIEIMNAGGPGIGHDQVTKNGDLVLKGTLRVTETGTVPDGVYAIVLVTGGSISGDFDNVILPPGYTLSKTAAIVIVTKNSTLPVKLTNFTARRVDHKVQMNWQTLSESNSDRFEIERSKPGGTYLKIGEINAAGYSNQLKNYEFTDNSPEKGLNLYRLRQVDKDNQFEFSEVKWVRFDDTKDDLIVFPTITNGFISVLANEKTTVELFDLHGVRLLRREINNSTQIDLSNYAGGIYLLRNIKNGRSYKLIKK